MTSSWQYVNLGGFRKLHGIMTGNDDGGCYANCSSRGDCYNGTCVCEIEFQGGNCSDQNLGYVVGFGTVYYIICAISIVQLCLCIHAEYCRLEVPRLRDACAITTQKLLYVLTIFATATRAAYFTTKEHIPSHWSSNLMSAYYPILLTGFSLLVCFWAEAYHDHEADFQDQQFLSKSYIAFTIFNFFIYLLLLAQIVSTEIYNTQKQVYAQLQSIFNGCFAAFMLIIFVFFIVYGVEVYFKVRGAFKQRRETQVVNSQWHMSRLGLIVQAGLQLFTAIFLMSDVLGRMWKDQVEVFNRNFYSLTFRIVELGVAVWFPCVLWNWHSPEQLWILNPSRLLSSSQHDDGKDKQVAVVGKALSPTERSWLLRRRQKVSYDPVEGLQTSVVRECWICYGSDDDEGADTNQWIEPCLCKGDTRAVHHDCLKRWLLQPGIQENDDDAVDKSVCSVCKHPYQLSQGNSCFAGQLTLHAWLQGIAAVITLASLPVSVYLAFTFTMETWKRLLVLGSVLLIQYFTFRFFGFNLVSAYHTARLQAIQIFSLEKPEKKAEKEASPTPRHVFLQINETSAGIHAAADASAAIFQSSDPSV